MTPGPIDGARLHPHDQPGCHRPLWAHPDRRPGRGASRAPL